MLLDKDGNYVETCGMCHSKNCHWCYPPNKRGNCNCIACNFRKGLITAIRDSIPYEHE